MTDKGKKYKLFFPVEYKSKPLPLINQGDFYAVHVVSTRLGVDNLDIEPIRRDSSPDQVTLEGDAILICAPHANPALRKLCDVELNSSELPCWFIEDTDTDGYTIRRIRINGNDTKLESLAEKSHKEAFMSSKSDNHINKGITDVEDYGIFARLHEVGNQYIIIAGIHQLGTWIVASLLSNLLSELLHFLRQ